MVLQRRGHARSWISTGEADDRATSLLAVAEQSPAVQASSASPSRRGAAKRSARAVFATHYETDVVIAGSRRSRAMQFFLRSLKSRSHTRKLPRAADEA